MTIGHGGSEIRRWADSLGAGGDIYVYIYMEKKDKARGDINNQRQAGRQAGREHRPVDGMERERDRHDFETRREGQSYCAQEERMIPYSYSYVLCVCVCVCVPF